MFRQAFRAGWLSSEAAWLAMIEDRNLITHIYNERTAEQVWRHVDDAVLSLRGAFDVLVGRSG